MENNNNKVVYEPLTYFLAQDNNALTRENTALRREVEDLRFNLETYRGAFGRVRDYALWLERHTGTRGRNIPAPLLRLGFRTGSLNYEMTDGNRRFFTNDLLSWNEIIDLTSDTESEDDDDEIWIDRMNEEEDLNEERLLHEERQG